MSIASGDQSRSKSQQPKTVLKKNSKSTSRAMNAATSPATDGQNNTGRKEADNVDRIRDILFGGQMRDYETKFARVEERLAKETAEMREDLKRRLSSLEAFIKGELSALGDKMRVEKEERTQAIKALNTEFSEQAKAVDKRITQFETVNEKAHRELREQLLSETNRLAEEISQKTRELGVALKRDGEQLRGSLAHRQTLAELFAQMAIQIGGDGAETRDK